MPWTQRDNDSHDTWNRRDEDGAYGYVSRYEPNATSKYNWQAARGEYFDERLSGSANTREDAIDAADAALAMPADEFNALIAQNMIDRLREIESRLLRIMPTSDILPGYHAGYEAGQRDLRAKIDAALA